MIEASQLPHKLCEGLTAHQLESLTGEGADLAVELLRAQGLDLVSIFATPILSGIAGPVTKIVLDNLKRR